jgi:hypothetical protein
MPIELRLCSSELAKTAPTELPVGKPLQWYIKRYGTAYGRSVYTFLSSPSARTYEQIVLAPRGVEFASPEQIGWAIHVAGAVASEPGQPDTADEIDAFAMGDEAYSSVVPPLLRDLGAYSLLTHERCIAYSRWIARVDRVALAAEATDLHGAEWVSSILAVVNNLQGIFESVEIHGGEICCWRRDA